MLEPAASFSAWYVAALLVDGGGAFFWLFSAWAMRCFSVHSGRAEVIRQTRGGHSLKMGAASQMLPVVAGFGANFVATPYVVWRLGLYDFGVWALTGAIAQYAGLVGMGFSRAASRYVAIFSAKGDAKSEGAVVGICVTVLVVLGGTLGGLSLLSAPLVDRLLGVRDPRLVTVLLLCTVTVLIVGLLARVMAGASLGRGRYLSGGVGVATLSVLQVIGGAAALVVRPSLTAFAVGTVAGATIGFGVVIATILLDEHQIIIGWPRGPLVRDVLWFGFTSQIGAAGDILILQSGKVIAGIMVGPSAAAVFELANRLAMGANAIGGAAASALTVHMSRSYSAGGMESMLRQYEHLTQRYTAVVLLVPAALTATAASAIPLWLGNNEGQVVLVLLALLAGIAVNLSTGVCTSTFAAMGRPGTVAQVCVVAGVFQSMFAAVMGHGFGFWGIVISFAIGVPIVKLVGLWWMQARVEIPLSLYLRAVRGPYLVALTAIFVAMPVGVFLTPHNRESAVVPFLASGALFGVTYALLGWRCGYLPRVRLPRRRFNGKSGKPEGS